MTLDHQNFSLRLHGSFLIAGRRNDCKFVRSVGEKSDGPKASVQTLHRSFGIKICIWL